MIKISANNKILFIGDSITDVKFNRRMNCKIHGKKSYPLQATDEMKRHCHNLKFDYKGIASNRTYHIYDRLTQDCIDIKPNVIVMLIGVNDAWEHYVPEQYPPLRRPLEPHMREVYRRIQEELDDCQILFLLPFMIDSVEEKLPFHKILNEYRDKLRLLAQEYHAEYIDLQEEFDLAQKIHKPKELAIDGIHPTNLGHKVIADAIMKHIQFV